MGKVLQEVGVDGGEGRTNTLGIFFAAGRMPFASVNTPVLIVLNPSLVCVAPDW